LERIGLDPRSSVDYYQCVTVDQILLWVGEPAIDGHPDTQNEEYRLTEYANHGDDQSKDERQVQVGPMVVPVDGLFLHLLHTAIFYHMIRA